MTNAELEQIGRILADYFGEPYPCRFDDIRKYMERGKGKEWCEKHCANVTRYECWARYLRGKLRNRGIEVEEEE